MFLPILLFNVLLVLSDGAPWQQKKASVVVVPTDFQSPKCRDGRDGIQIEDAKRDFNGLMMLASVVVLEAMDKFCPYELSPFVRHCKTTADDKLFCMWKGFLIRVDADADKCVEKREAEAFLVEECGIPGRPNKGGTKKAK
ncbi:hypothetical protein GPALN_014575 [Globodera pallida]|nr:hypothetical protein GPALN_014575 [Globodera pallida]